MSVPPGTWSNLSVNFTINMKILVNRCESDCEGREALYDRTKLAIMDARR